MSLTRPLSPWAWVMGAAISQSRVVFKDVVSSWCAGWHPDASAAWLRCFPGWASALQGMQRALPGSPSSSSSSELGEQRVSGARVAYSLQQLRADAARVPGVWCDGAGAMIPFAPQPCSSSFLCSSCARTAGAWRVSAGVTNFLCHILVLHLVPFLPSAKFTEPSGTQPFHNVRCLAPAPPFLLPALATNPQLTYPATTRQFTYCSHPAICQPVTKWITHGLVGGLCKQALEIRRWGAWKQLFWQPGSWWRCVRGAATLP